MKKPLSALSLFLWIIQMAHLFAGNQNSLAVLSEERDSLLHSLPILSCYQLLLTSCSAFCQLWSELVKTYFSNAVALFSSYLACSEHIQISWHHLMSTIQLLIALTTSQMDPTPRPPVRYTPIQHHHTCNRRKPHLICSPRSGLQTVVARPCTASLSSSCLSTFPLRIVKKYILWCDGEFQICQKNPQSFICASTAMWHCVHPWMLWTVYAHFLQSQCCGFPTDNPRNRIRRC